MQLTAPDLLDRLIDCWGDWEQYDDDHLKALASAIVTGTRHLMANELEIVGQLRGLLSAEQWERLHDRRRVTASTAHKYKGLEKDAVIVLDADAGSYPLIHPNWVFLRLFGGTIERIESEERRLFYVALTRSRHTLVVLSDDPNRESPYLIDIKRRMKLDSIAWEELPPAPSLEGARIEVRVSNAYSVRDQLKNVGYRWNELTRCWFRSVMAEGFDFEALCGQPWAQPGVRIEVYSETGELLKGHPPRR